MIQGTVTYLLEPTVELLVRKPGGQTTPITFVVDTGYTGTLTLKPDLIRFLDLQSVGSGTATLADGSRIGHAVYEVELEWDGRVRVVHADEADTDPVIGCLLLADHRVSADMADGGTVTIERL